MKNKWTNGDLTTLQIQKRFSVVKTLASVVISLTIAFILMALQSNNPIEALKIFLTAPLTNWNRFCGMINKLTPLLFTSCAVCLMYSAGQINLATQSSFYLGGVLCTLIATLDGVPTGVHFILTAMLAMVVGAAVCFIPAIMHTKFKTIMFISALMLNYVIDNIVKYLLHGPLRDPASGFEATKKIAESSKLFTLFSSKATDVHVGLLLGFVVVFLTYFIIFRTSYGQKLRTIGANRAFATFSGIKVEKMIIITCLIGGAIAGLGGATEVCGIYTRVNWEACPSYGSDGIMIAMIAHNNPLLVPFASLFLAYIRTSAEALNMYTSIPIEIVQIIQAIVISFVAASAFLQDLEHRTIIKNSQAMAKKVGEENV